MFTPESVKQNIKRMSMMHLVKMYNHNVDKDGYYPINAKEAVDLVFWARLWIGTAIGCIAGSLRIRGYIPIVVAFLALMYPNTIIAKATNIPMHILKYCNLTGGFSAFVLVWILLYSAHYTP
ncbi:Hypothetical protein GL50581_1915 [Giardia duodenalis ATCC 50581]|uniref:Uncharacterized protein n=1 Tax=Giardia intestinalis (strain ATCC 50581 / GS clone H7) TaxID=598745 RepID=C6LT22_GIAIB|nr:Hypothetical protein GL50581_1915 [Giardia intestinalis ATCC 50581]